MKRISLFSILCCYAIIAAAQTYSGGSGTASDPYLISTINDLYMLNDAVNDETEEKTQDQHFLLTGDITTPFTGMIGTEGVFRGTFDGGGHCITLDINRDDSYVGLFGTTIGATICNLQVNGNVFANHYVGGIVGNPSNGTLIENCVNHAEVIGSTRVGGIAGGIVSVKQYGEEGVTVRNCANCGKVSGMDIVGGVIGYSGQQIGNTLTRLINYGHIDAPERTGNERLGGVIGNPLHNDIVSGLVNLGTISNRTISGIMGNSNPESQSELFYDCQMSPSLCVFPQQALTTSDIIGNGLISSEEGSVMTSDHWIAADAMLPRLKMNGIENDPRMILAATPILIGSEEHIDSIAGDFRVGTAEGVEWSSVQGKVRISADGTATPIADGDDELIARLGSFERRFMISIKRNPMAIGYHKTTERTTAIYDLQGRQIVTRSENGLKSDSELYLLDNGRNLTKGIYIVNGKKIIVR